MARGGSFDFRQVERLQQQIRQLQQDHDKMCRECAKYLAQRFLRIVTQKTVVDTGTLRRGWTVGEIQKQGDNYTVEIINQTEYASYVEYGHRTPSHKGWVPGKFMMTISEQQIQAQAPAILERNIYNLLRRALGDA